LHEANAGKQIKSDRDRSGRVAAEKILNLN
jgi:hypothetical protein